MYWGPVDAHGQPARSRNSNLVKPDNLNQMLEISNILSKDFPYVRVDLYSFNNAIYFGELTFHPGAGLESFIPSQLDKQYGKKLIINCES